MTTVAAPMVHDTIPFIGTKSYLYDDKEENVLKKSSNILHMLRYTLIFH